MEHMCQKLERTSKHKCDLGLNLEALCLKSYMQSRDLYHKPN